jgi:3-oxoacyl-(acyl-carrier-protein) synthase
MSSVCIVSAGKAESQNLASLDESPAFRKATLNMKLAHLALQSALAPLASYQEDFKKKMSLFLGTGHGEFNTTLEFLKSWAQQKFARPFVFQNSLHNSTTGFLSLHEGYQAPSCTASHHYFSGEDALDLAMQFILTGMSDIAAVIGVDSRTGDHLPLLKEAGFPHAEWGEGAGAIILASRAYCEEKNLKVLGRLKAIQTQPCLDHPVYRVQPTFNLSHFYDSHAVEVLAEAVLHQGDTELHLEKPNGSRSQISWVRDV